MDDVLLIWPRHELFVTIFSGKIVWSKLLYICRLENLLLLAIWPWFCRCSPADMFKRLSSQPALQELKCRKARGGAPHEISLEREIAEALIF